MVDEPLTSVDVKAFFERVSVDWYEMRSSFYNAGVIDALAEHATVGPQSTVVDVGTGTGFVAAGLARVAAAVVGVENFPGHAYRRRGQLERLGLHNVELREGDVDALRLPDDSVDAAVANMVLHHAVEPATMLTEMARVVRPGGMVAVTDEKQHRYEWMRTEQADMWLGFTRREVEGFFQAAGLDDFGYASLGMQ